MRALIQRVSEAEVTVEGETLGRIGPGLVVLLGVAVDDGPEEAGTLAVKTANLRIFSDEEGKMNLSLLDTGGEVLAISQFTLYADTSRGRRPSFVAAAGPDRAESLYRRFIEELRSLGLKVAEGRFGAHMRVSLVNDGPVTIMMET